MGETTISATVQMAGMAAFAGARDVYVENLTQYLAARFPAPPAAPSPPERIGHERFYPSYQHVIQQAAVFLKTNPSQNRNPLLSLFTVDPGNRRKPMAEALICSGEPEPECDPAGEASPREEDWREATLKRLEAWIEERERLIAEIERRIKEVAKA